MRKVSSESLSIYAKQRHSPDHTLEISGNNMVLAHQLRGLFSMAMHCTAVTWLALSQLVFPTGPLDILNIPPQQ